MPPIRSNCLYCGGPPEEEQPAQVRPARCPGCGAEMDEVAEGGLTLDRCPSCRGVWFDRGELEAAIEAKKARAAAQPGPQPEAEHPGDDLWAHLPGVGAAEAPPPSSPTKEEVVYRPCPRCQARMQRKNYQRVSGVIIDVCGNHGAYLDAGELDQIAAYEKNPPPPVDDPAQAPAIPPRTGYDHSTAGSAVGWAAADVGVDVVATVVGAIFFDW